MSFEGRTREIHCEVSDSTAGASIKCMVIAPRWKKFRHCKVDPGAGLTIIPHWIWEKEYDIREIQALDDHPHPITGAGNVPLECKTGPLKLCVEGYRECPTHSIQVGMPLAGVEKAIHFLGECQVLFNMNPKHDRPCILLGLGGGTFQTGGFCINWRGCVGKPKAVFVEQLSSEK